MFWCFCFIGCVFLIGRSLERRGERNDILSFLYALALILARALLSSKRRCFFNRMTLKRSKSVRFFRRSFCTRFLYQLLAFHCSSTLAASQALLTAPDRAPRGSLVITMPVRSTSEKEMDCRVTPPGLASVAGPSTRAYRVARNSRRVSKHCPLPAHSNLPFALPRPVKKHNPLAAFPPIPRLCAQRTGEPTRLWSMISTIVARRPAYGPLPCRRTTRPSSTSRHLEPTTVASPIVMIVRDLKEDGDWL